MSTQDPTIYQEGSEAAERFYYADGQKVPLAVSTHYVAVRGRADAARGAAAAHVAESLSTMMAPAQVFDLPEYNLSVIEVPADGRAVRGQAPVAALRAAVDTEPELTLGPPVYEPLSSPVSEGLIPIGEILVKFEAGTSQEDQRRLIEENQLEVRRQDYPEPGACLMATGEGADAIDVANRLQENPLVEYAQPNFVRLAPRLQPLERRFGNGTGGDVAVLEAEPPTLPRLPELEKEVLPAAPHNDPGLSSQWALPKIKALEAFDISMGSAAIAVAVLDEGCDLNHEDITYRLPGYDAVTGSDNPQPQGNDAHGIACAGIVAMRANNRRGGVGVAPKCQILPVRIARGANGGGWYTTDAIIADGIRTAVNRNADVLSNSWGGGGASTAITNAFRYAQTSGRGGKGCPIAAATGNNDVRGVIYPARLSPTIAGFLAVGASNQWDERKSRTSRDGETWWGSNYGPEVDVVAPGVKIYTTDIMGSAGYSSGNYVPDFNGTSSATPHVAGLMGLILSVDPDLRSWEVEDIIKLTADDLGPAGRDPEFGFGRINCRRALEAASRIWYSVQVQPEFLGSGRECYMRMNIRMYNPGINSVRLNRLTVRSLTSDRSSEVDRFEFRPNPGGTMQPYSNDDVRLNRLLLRANGNRSSWNYQWSLSWTYTYWRPSAPRFPLGVQPSQPLVESEGRLVESHEVHGQGSGTLPPAVPVPDLTERPAISPDLLPDDRQVAEQAHNGRTVVTIDGQGKAVTIVIG